MKKISKKELANYLEVSQKLMYDVKKKRQKFGKKSARRISILNSVTFEDFMFLNGEMLTKKTILCILRAKW